MFVDKVKVFIKSGDGGDGRVSFRREKYVPNGGPDGGDGGNGGNVVFIADGNLRTLLDFRYKRKYVAENGEIGGGSNSFGKDGKDLYIKIPAGTVIKDAETGSVMGDLKEEGQQLIVAKGGKGGKGNARFATSTRQTPRFAHPGDKGIERWIELELKLIADVGLIGFPNVGKSTLLSVVTAAKPKIANYHFTTLSPNLGVVKLDNNRNFVMADIPGIIEGAHKGVGLGHSFLRHIERTKVIIHILDVSGIEGRNPLDDFKKINEELKLYSEKLSSKYQIVACNKMDIPGSEKNFEKVKSFLSKEGYEVFPISGATRKGIKELLDNVYNALENYEGEEELVDEYDESFYNDEAEKKAFEIRIEDGIYVVEGRSVDEILSSINVFDSYSLGEFAIGVPNYEKDAVLYLTEDFYPVG